MRYLTKHEILVMLETRSPDVIREQERARLDESGLALLAEEERSLSEADQFSKNWGQQFEGFLPPVPELKLQHEYTSSVEESEPGITSDISENHQPRTPSKNGSWWCNSRQVSNAMLTIAATLILGFATLSWFTFQDFRQSVDVQNSPQRTRGGTDETTPIHILNEALYSALFERGKHFLKEGKRDKNPDKLKEALMDFSEARGLKENYDVLTHLAFTYEALGNQEKANELVEKALALDREEAP